MDAIDVSSTRHVAALRQHCLHFIIGSVQRVFDVDAVCVCCLVFVCVIRLSAVPNPISEINPSAHIQEDAWQTCAHVHACVASVLCDGKPQRRHTNPAFMRPSICRWGRHLFVAHQCVDVVVVVDRRVVCESFACGPWKFVCICSGVDDGAFIASNLYVLHFYVFYVTGLTYLHKKNVLFSY